MSFGPISGLPSHSVYRTSTCAGLDVDAFDAAAAVVGWELDVGDRETDQLAERPAAAVADVERAVGPDRGAVRAPARRGDLRLGPVGLDPGDAPALQLDDDHAAVGHRDRTFGELQSGRDLGDLRLTHRRRTCSLARFRPELSIRSRFGSRYGHAHTDGTAGRVHARARSGVELQRVDVLQRVRPRGTRRRLPPPRQPRQRGLRRADNLPLPARRPGRVHLQPPEDHEQRRVRRRRDALRGRDPVRGAAHHVRRQARAAHRAVADGEPPEGVHREPVGRGARRPGAPRRFADVRRRTRERRREPRSRKTTRAGSHAVTTNSTWR